MTSRGDGTDTGTDIGTDTGADNTGPVCSVVLV